jgi:hypothetical protein
MAWDPNRPVPWKRLVREWLVYVGIMTVILLIIYRDRLSPSLFAGLLVSGPIYLVIGGILAKFGYQRPTLRSARSAPTTTSQSARTTSSARTKPAPTKRTGGGTSKTSGSNRR